jgi:soluble lytic murein transglycosylase-like protein/TolA-binding protein
MLTLLLALVGPVEAALPGEVQAALRRGDCEVVKAALKEDRSFTAALARGGCGDNAALEARLGEGGALDGYARLLVARDFVDFDPVYTEELLEGVSLPGSAGLEARMIRARALIGQGRSLEARTDLRALLETDAGAEARYWLSWGAEKRGEIEAAVETYRSVWARFVESPFAEQAERRLAALDRPVPDYESAAGRELAMTRANNLLRAFRPEEAVVLMDGVAEATGVDSAKWHHDMGFARMKARDNAGAVAEWDRLNPTAPGAYGGAEMLFNYALATSRTGDYAAAALAYEKVYKLYPGTSQADFASYKIGYLDYDAGELEGAIPKLEAHLRRFPGSKHGDEAHWFIAWSHYRLGHMDEADAWLDRLIAGYGSSGLSVGARYWKARIRGQRGDADGERAGMEAVLRGWPSSGYAWFAAERLGRRFEGIGEVQVPALPADLLERQPDLALGLELAEAGLYDWARERMMAASGAATGSREVAVAMAHALIDVGAYSQAQALARPWCGAPWSGGDPAAMAACYPRPEAPVVSAAAGEVGLNALLPYAIMTAESALQPEVTSPAGARGLMQLMPYLGEELHGELLPGSRYDADRLYTPGYNAWLGTTELGRLHGRFGEGEIQPSLPLVIAGYNGGADAVARWVTAEDGSGEADRFAENIGYTETRRYVRRVLGFLMNYRWIYGDE